MPIHLETSGVDQISGDPSWITLSPKPHAPPLLEVLATCHELKVVIHEKSDLEFAEDMVKKIIQTQDSRPESIHQPNNPTEQPLLFLQPGWENVEGQRLAIEHVKRNPQWRLSMQTHKWLGVL